MKLNTLEKDEQIIQILEELDSNYSTIRALLRDIRTKISKFSDKNKQVVEDCTLWINFFESETKNACSPISELQLSSSKFKELENSPNLLNTNAPKNPFLEIETSELFNKSIMKSLKTSTVNDSSTSAVENDTHIENKLNTTISESEENDGEIRPFDISDIPQIFQNEADLYDLYKFIEKKRVVSMESVIKEFESISPKKMEIFLALLSRKNFIKQKEGKLSIE